MATPATPQPQLTLEQQIDSAAEKASTIVQQFSPQAAAAVAAGAEVEPIISGIVQMFISLFRHHAKQTITSTPAQ